MAVRDCIFPMMYLTTHLSIHPFIEACVVWSGCYLYVCIFTDILSPTQLSQSNKPSKVCGTAQTCVSRLFRNSISVIKI